MDQPSKARNARALNGARGSGQGGSGFRVQGSEGPPTTQNSKPRTASPTTHHPELPADHFAFEELEVWQDAVAFSDNCLSLAERLERDGRSRRLIDQFQAACVSPAQNIAEGKGRFSKKEFVHFLYIARGSLFETVTLLMVFARRKWTSVSEFGALRRDALQLTKRLNSLIGAIKA